ncbi:MAG: hypothetical protein AB7O96_13160 [Pseudobdellovibrionaceae bacterium]
MSQLLIALLMSTFGFAAEPFSISCVTEYPTTSHLAVIKGDRLEVFVYHHNGTDYMPAYTGTMTPHDVPKVLRAAKILPMLGKEWKFSWPLNKCKFHEGHRFECFGGAEKVTLGGMEVDPFTIYSSQATESTIAGVRETTSIHLSLYINNENFMTTMPYEKNECYRSAGK